jgi:hypothetical protein
MVDALASSVESAMQVLVEAVCHLSFDFQPIGPLALTDVTTTHAKARNFVVKLRSNNEWLFPSCRRPVEDIDV